MKLPVDYDGLMPGARKVVREEYARLQNGKCWHCERDLSGVASVEVMTANIRHSLFPSGFFTYPTHLHHSHVTGKTIGAVHARCNAYLWQFLGE